MLNTFQPEIVIFLNTLSLSPKKVCVFKKKLVYLSVYQYFCLSVCGFGGFGFYFRNFLLWLFYTRFLYAALAPSLRELQRLFNLCSSHCVQWDICPNSYGHGGEGGFETPPPHLTLTAMGGGLESFGIKKRATDI